MPVSARCTPRERRLYCAPAGAALGAADGDTFPKLTRRPSETRELSSHLIAIAFGDDASRGPLPPLPPPAHDEPGLDALTRQE